MTILVTGATGFVGSVVVRRLLAAGEVVRVLVRPASDLRNIEGLDVEAVRGDLGAPESLGRAVAGCEALFHVAADYRYWAPRPGEVYATNVGGTRSLMRAAMEAGIARIVYQPVEKGVIDRVSRHGEAYRGEGGFAILRDDEDDLNDQDGSSGRNKHEQGANSARHGLLRGAGADELAHQQR